MTAGRLSRRLREGAVVAGWDNFAVVAGGSSSALTGLLFVSVSLNADRIAPRPALRARAAQTLVLFMTPLVIAIVLLTPGQRRAATGSELMALAVIVGIALVGLGRRRTAPAEGQETKLVLLLDRTSPTLGSTLLILVAGITTMVGHGGGNYWLVPAVILTLVSGVVNAWWFLLPPV
jgi:hypothetical protein